MVSLSVLFSALRDYEGLLDICSHRQLDLFIRLGRHFRPEIEFHSPIQCKDPPYSLPRYLIIFLSGILCLDTSVLSQLWNALKGFIWAYKDGSGDFEAPQLSPHEIEAINHSGARSLRIEEKLGMFDHLNYFNCVFFSNSMWSLHYVLSSNTLLCQVQVTVAMVNLDPGSSDLLHC